MREPRFALTSAVLIASAIGICGIACIGSLQTHSPGSMCVARPPPEPLPEVQSGPPAPGMAWLAGYWHYNGTDYVWIPGHWESPRPGLVWKPPSVQYSADQKAWVYELGRWQESGARAAR